MSPEYRIFQKNVSSSNHHFWGSTFLLLGSVWFLISFCRGLTRSFFCQKLPQFFQAKKSLAFRPSTCFASTSRVPWPRLGCWPQVSTRWVLPEMKEAFPSLGMSFCSITWKKLTQQVLFKNNPSPARFPCHQLTYLEVIRSSRILTNKSAITGVSWTDSDLENLVNIETQPSWKLTMHKSVLLYDPSLHPTSVVVVLTPRRVECSCLRLLEKRAGETTTSWLLWWSYFPLEKYVLVKSGNHEPKTCPFPYPIKKVKKGPGPLCGSCWQPTPHLFGNKNQQLMKRSIHIMVHYTGNRHGSKSIHP